MTTSEKRVGRVLVADDEEGVRTFLAESLERAGHEVTQMADGEAALRAVHDEPFDVVLLDMQMPVKDGYTTARELRARGFKQPIIAVTAHAMQGDRQRCLEVGCNDYTPKPLEPRRLLELIAHYCRKPVRRGAASATEPFMSERTFELVPHQVPGLSAAPPSQPRRQNNEESSGPKAPGSSRRVLLVDDSTDACLAQSMLLKMLGYEVQTASSGRDALAVYDRFKPDIVLLDLGMPEMSGFDVVRQLRGKPGGDHSLYIALSGRCEAEDRAKAREAGFHRYAVKPVELADLEKMIRPTNNNTSAPAQN